MDKKEFTVQETVVETIIYRVTAGSKEEARELVLTDDGAPEITVTDQYQCQDIKVIDKE